MVRVDEVVKRYRNGTLALAGVSFDIAAGTITGLLGPNGAGKSTLVRVITGTLPPTRGCVSVCGFDVQRSPLEAKRCLAVVTQFAGLNPSLTVREHIETHCRLRGASRAASRAAAEEALAAFGLEAFAHRTPRELSGGLQRRVQLAQATALRPQVLILDEPTVGVDPVARALYWKELDRLQRDLGVTILLSSHSMDEVERLCQRVLLINRGMLVRHATLDDVRAAGGTAVLSLDVDAPLPAALAQELAAWLGPDAVRVAGSELRISASNPAGCLPPLLTRLSEHGVGIRQFRYEEPSLEEAYLRLFGGSAEGVLPDAVG